MLRLSPQKEEERKQIRDRLPWCPLVETRDEWGSLVGSGASKRNFYSGPAPRSSSAITILRQFCTRTGRNGYAARSTIMSTLAPSK